VKRKAAESPELKAVRRERRFYAEAEYADVVADSETAIAFSK
jgi:hypothetical protein